MLPIAALVAANILWGINNPLIKLGLESIPIPIFISIRFVIISLILLPFALRVWKPLQRRDVVLLVAASFLYITVSTYLLNIGLTKTSASNASIIDLLAPLLLFALAVIFLKEKLHLKTFLGLMVALAASLLIIGRPGEGSATGSDALLGNLIVVASVFCYVISVLIQKPLTKKTSPIQLAFMSIFPGTVLVTLYALTQLKTWDFAATTQASWLAMSASTLAVLGANLFFFYALSHKTAQSTGVYSYINPLAAITAAWFLLEERPSPLFAVSALLVIVGLYIVEARKVTK